MTALKRLPIWLSYPRGIALTLASGLWTLFMSVIVFTTAAVTRHRGAVDFTINKMWTWPIVKLAGIRLEVRGAENVRPDGPGSVLLFNHSSLFDILVLNLAYPRSFRFGAKIELFGIPLFGTAMRLVGVLPIDRRHRHRVMKIYDAAVTRVRAGESFALAPEGTRQMEPRLGCFKRGPFEFAINAHADVQPVVIAGAFEVIPRDSVWINQGRWRRKVIVEILPPLPTAGMVTGDAHKLLEATRARMAPVHERSLENLRLE